MSNQLATNVIDIQLVLVRGLLDRADHAARAGADVDLMMAMLLADVANETIAKTVLNDLGLSVNGNMADFRQRLEDAIPALAGHTNMAAATRLRQARNPVQHAGMVPARTQVLAHLTDARAFVSLLVQEAWQRDFGQVSVASLVHDPELAPTLQSAVRHLRAGELLPAAVEIGAVYEAIRIRFKRAARFAGGVGVTTRDDRFLPAIASPTAGMVFGTERMQAWTEPRLADDEYGPAAELVMGFSLEEMALLRHLLDITDRLATHDEDAEPLEIEVSPPQLEHLLEVVARQLWRLESEQPTLFGTYSDPALYRHADTVED